MIDTPPSPENNTPPASSITARILRLFRSTQVSPVFSQAVSSRVFSQATIRTRLILILIAFALIPILISASIASGLQSRSSRESSINSLSAVAAIKTNQVEDWLTGLQNSLAAELARDADTLRLLIDLADSPLFAPIYETQIGAFQSAVQAANSPFEELFLLNLRGDIILSTSLIQEGKNFALHPFFQNGLNGAFLQGAVFNPTNQTITIIASAPIVSENGQVVGVLAGRAKIVQLNKILTERVGMGETGETYLVAPNYALITNSRFPGYPTYQTYVRTNGAANALQRSSSADIATGGQAEYENYRRANVLGVYRYIPSINAALLSEQELQETLSAQRLMNNITIAAAGLIILLALTAAVWIADGFTRPLAELTRSANLIAAGKLQSAELQSSALPLSALAATRQDEIGSLASAFNTMTIELQNLISSLEERVASRTVELQNRTEQLLAASEVSSSIAAFLDIEPLIQRVVDLIRQRFDLYYVGLFLVDERKQNAVLKAGTGQPGRAMLARGHQLKIGEGSMIGWSIANAQARIALEAGEDPVRLATPDLPDTRSEAAIPLRSRGQVLGALTIQSARPGAFEPAAIAIFQTMADQVAIAIDNARLFSETQQALQTVRQAYGELSRQAWLERLRQKPLGFQRDAQGLLPIFNPSSSRGTPEQIPHTPEQIPPTPARVPIMARGQTIGYITAQKPGASSQSAGAANPPQFSGLWLPDEIDLLENLADQLGIALDSARLFEETQQQAERQRLISEITALMRATLDIDTVLQTAAREMRQALDLAEVEVRLGTPQALSAPSEASKDEE